MERPGRLLLVAVLIGLIVTNCTPADAREIHRSSAERAKFQRLYPCPANGKKKGSCPGYVVDHIVPLCAGGEDKVFNMQWQTIPQALAKDRDERAMCRRKVSLVT